MARLQRSYWLQEVLNLQYDTWGYFTSARRLAESSFICCIEPENNQKRYGTKNWQIGSCLKVCFWGEMFIVFLLFNCWSSLFEWTFVSSEALLACCPLRCTGVVNYVDTLVTVLCNLVCSGIQKGEREDTMNPGPRYFVGPRGQGACFWVGSKCDDNPVQCLSVSQTSLSEYRLSGSPAWMNIICLVLFRYSVKYKAWMSLYSTHTHNRLMAFCSGLPW